MMFGVFDNNKPASTKGFPHLKGEGWDSHIFGSLKDAETYVEDWLGNYFSKTTILRVNVPYDYNSHGDMIEIREIPVHMTHHDNCPCWKA